MSAAELAALIRAHQPCVVLTGAGVSTESGIPDFRSPTGLWAQYDPLDYASIRSFRADPARVWTFYALRYEALAGPAEEAGTSDGLMASDLTEIAEPQASEQAIVDAKEAIASDAGAVTYDIPITVNDSVLKVLAAFQTDLHGVIGRGLARSGRYIPILNSRRRRYAIHRSSSAVPFRRTGASY